MQPGAGPTDWLDSRWRWTALAVTALAFSAWSLASVRALRPSALVVDARSDTHARVTLVAVSTDGAESESVHELAAGTEAVRLALALPDAEIAALRIELREATSPLQVARVSVLDRRGKRVVSVLPRFLEPLEPAQVSRAKGSVVLSPPVPGERAAATLDLGVVYAGGRRLAALSWTLLGVVLVGLVLNLPRSPLSGLFAKPVRRRAAAAALALAVLTGTAAMACSSLVNAHPDEASHVKAAAYYEHAWLPAPVGDPRLEPTVIPGWGISYLFELDVVYFAAGRLAGLTGLSVASACRLLQWLLLASILALAVGSLPSVPSLAVVCGLTPQAWYLFSYFNGDAWPLAFALAASLVLALESLPARLLGEERATRLRWALALGLLFGVVLVSKANYRVFVGWAVAVLALRLRVEHGRLLSKPPLRALALVCGTALLVLGVRAGHEQAINGFERSARVEAFVEAHAEPSFLRGANLEGEGMPGMYLRDRGKSIGDVLRRDWLAASIESALGVYGRLEIRGPKSWYRIAALAVLCVVTVLAAAAWRARAPGGRLVLALTLVGVLLVALQSLYFSWTYSFQPQGRYLFPALPMLVVALAPGARHLSGRLLAFLALVPLGLSLWSFVAVALERVAS